MRVQDFHTHAGTWEFDVHLTDFWGIVAYMKSLGIGRFGVTTTADGDNSALVRSMTHSGIMFNTDVFARWDFIYWLNPRKGTPSSETLAPDNPALRDLELIGREAVAVKFHPSWTRTRIDDPLMEPFLDWCEKKRKPLLIHCGRWNEFANYKYAVDLSEKRNLTLVLAHMGGPAYDLKTKALDYIAEHKPRGRLMVDTSTCFMPYLIEKAVRIMGKENVIFGSDYPLYHPIPTAQNILISGISQDAKKAILWGNYERLRMEQDLEPKVEQ